MIEKSRRFYSNSTHIIYTMKCESCQCEFEAKRKDSKYCTDACRKMVQRERKKANLGSSNDIK
jgi:hypothetical protein